MGCDVSAGLYVCGKQCLGVAIDVDCLLLFHALYIEHTVLCCSICSYQSVSILPRPKDASRNAFTQPVTILKRQPISDPCLADSSCQK